MTDKWIDVDGCRVHYTVSSECSEPVIVLMHGWGCSVRTLASVEQVAVGLGYRVVNIDFPGHGQSAEPPEVWGVEQYTAVLESVIAAEGASNPVLLGHSFGGRVAICYASKHKDVAKVMLVDAAGIKPRRKLSYYAKVYSFKAWKRLLYAVMGHERAEKKLAAVRAKAGSADYAASSPMMRAVLSRVVNEDLRHLLPAISAPTLLVWGEADTATPLSDAKLMERLIPDAGLVSFAGCGHYSFLDNPYRFAAVMRSFLTH